MSSSTSTDAELSSDYSFMSALTLLSSASKDPLFSSAWQQWIQQMIAAYTTQRSDRSALEIAAHISSISLETSSQQRYHSLLSPSEMLVSSYTRLNSSKYSNLLLFHVAS